MKLNVLCWILPMLLFFSCKKQQPTWVIDGSTAKHNYILLAKPDSAEHVTEISTGNTTPTELVAFANTLKGIPYKYASTDPEEGFDCSGFIAYVFNHFNIAVPRSSVDFTTVHQQISLKDARPGDLILFTGTDSTIRTVGHMGIITSKPNEAVTFIHSTSGKNKGVVETNFNGYYLGRYMKVVRVFGEERRFSGY